MLIIGRNCLSVSQQMLSCEPASYATSTKEIYGWHPLSTQADDLNYLTIPSSWLNQNGKNIAILEWFAVGETIVKVDDSESR